MNKNHKIKIKGLNYSYLSSGHGQPVFFLHGWGGNKESWEPLIKSMKEAGLSTDEYKFYSVDLPGFGESAEPATGWDVGDYLSWFEEFLKEIYQQDNLKGNYILVVHSFGGRMLMKMFERGFNHLNHLAKPERLVLIAAAGIKPTKTLRLGVAEAAAKLGKAVLSWPVLKKLAPVAQKILYKVLKTHDYEKTSGVMRETFIKVINEDLRNCLEEIKLPTLIIWGTDDSYLPLKDAHLMHQKISGSELKIIKKGRHGIHKTHAREIAEWIKHFLAK